jgi:hypothetical protein
MSKGQRNRTVGDVPAGPYFHGTRSVLAPGALLVTDTVSHDDDRKMCWATTSIESALQWALQRGRNVGPILYVYEVALCDVIVDINVHQTGTEEELTSVMSPLGRVVVVAAQMHEAEHPDASPSGTRLWGR